MHFPITRETPKKVALEIFKLNNKKTQSMKNLKKL